MQNPSAIEHKSTDLLNNKKIKRNQHGETKLHTQCKRGNTEFVRRLLDLGHPVNITDNNGWTPLHEACYHGHKEVVEMLLEKGAAINERGGDLRNGIKGITPLHDAAENGHLEVIQLLLDHGASAIAKSDNGNTPLDYLKNWHIDKSLNEPASALYDSLVQRMTRDSFLQRMITPEKSSHNTDENKLREEPKETTDDSMRCLRSRTKMLQKKSKNKATLVKTQIGNARRSLDDDWLESDINANTTKKRKTSLTENSLYSSNIRDKTSQSLDSNSICETAVRPSVILYTNTEKMPIKPMLSVKFCMDGQLYKVPVSLTEVRTCSIQWLAKKALKKYFKFAGVDSVLKLETKNGAILADDNLVSTLFSGGSSQTEELHAVFKSKFVPLIDRYEKICVDLNIESDENIKDMLSKISTILDLTNLALKCSKLLPLCKAINGQVNLYEINFCGNLMTDECMLQLCSSLPSICSLTKLNLSLNHLSVESLKYLADTFTNSDTPILEHLTHLDLSYNPLCTESLPYLAIITRYLKLRELNLAGVCFTSDIFSCFNNENVDLYLEDLEIFDISHNALNKNEIVTFVSWLRPQNIVELNLSDNEITEEGLLGEVVDFLKRNGEAKTKLKKLQLATCHIEDSEINSLLTELTQQNTAKTLEHLDLSYNDKLTSASLRRLLRLSPQTVDLHGCNNIMKYHECNSKKMWFKEWISPTGIKTLTVSRTDENKKDIDVLVELWEMKDKCIVETNDEGKILLSLTE